MRSLRSFLPDIFFTLFNISYICILCFILNYVSELYDIDGSVNGTYQSHAIYFSTQTEGDKSSINYSFLKDIDKKKFSVYIEHGGSVLGENIVFSNRKDVVKDGRTLNYDDFSSDQRVAVAGSLAEKVSTKTLLIQGKEYEIIGNKSEKSGSEIFTSFTDGNIASTDAQKVFVIEGKDKSTTNNVFAKIEKQLGKQGFSVSRIDVNRVSFSDFFSLRKPIFIMLILLLIVLVSITVIVTILWLYSKKRYLVACYIIGKPGGERAVLLNYLSIYALSTAVCIVITKLFLGLFINILVVLLIMAFVSALVFLLSFKSFKSKHYNELLEINYE